MIKESKCDKCKYFGSSETYNGQVCMPLNGKVVCIDHCIHQIVASLNAGGVKTVACCCGHGETEGRIDLEDGRILSIKGVANFGIDTKNYAETNTVDREFMESLKLGDDMKEFADKRLQPPEGE